MRSKPLILHYRLTPEMMIDTMMTLAPMSFGRGATGGVGVAFRMLGWLALAALMGLALRFYGRHPLVLVAVAASAGAAVGVVALQTTLHKAAWLSYRRIAERAAAEGEYRLEITEDRLREETAESLRQVALSQIDRVLRIDGASVLVANGLGFVVPDEALPDDMSPENLKDLLNWWRGE
ncbi:hypothetical protein [Sagittula salina]|uniref:YcxB-like protein domain-containing protein n=1 Tax=Sagittula salina TaxID=2820268 RepID=A0A940MVP4_9RHOB|nr:hypothetical protein [Sagittula salina]MBP0483749.1 hypothetical protein [Sagittula salina]